MEKFRLNRAAFLDACAKLAKKPVRELRTADFATDDPVPTLVALLAAANGACAISAPHPTLKVFVRESTRTEAIRESHPCVRHEPTGLVISGAPLNPTLTGSTPRTTGGAGGPLDGPDALCGAVEGVLACCDELLGALTRAIADIGICGVGEVSLRTGHPIVRVSERQLQDFLAGEVVTIRFADADGGGLAHWADEAVAGYRQSDIERLREQGIDYVIEHPVTRRQLLVTVIAPRALNRERLSRPQP